MCNKDLIKQINEEILELKLRTRQTQLTKQRIQQLQQKLNDLTNNHK